jgi:uncharacterized protein (TIGR00369 family)
MTDWLAGFGAAKAAGDASRLGEAIPYARFIGVRFALQADQLVATLAYSPHLIGNPMLPALHGGVIGAFLEHTALVHLMWDSDTIAGVPKTIDVTIDYLRSGRPVDTQARAIVTKHGRRVANVRAEAWQDDPAKPIAALHGHFLLR